jgi:hypothetical protein
MSNLGIGVMVNLLGGNESTVKAMQGAIGKQISDVRVADDRLVFRFTDNTGLALFDGGQSCCESRYMHTDDVLENFVGTILQNAEIKDGPEESGEYGDSKDSQFLVITTSKGQFTIVNYNEHNGYYGGFYIKAETL